MKIIIFGITILAVLTYINPAYAKAREVTVKSAEQPIAGLINDWHQFRASLIARTSQFNKYNDIKASQLATLPQALVGKWNMRKHHDNSGYKLSAVLDLRKNHKFSYFYQVRTGSSQQQFSFSGNWEVKNQILILLINQSNYPGEARHDVLFWRILHIGNANLVYVRSSADQLQAMIRQHGTRGS